MNAKKTPHNSGSKKRIIIFDLDGTLTESKSPITKEMSQLLTELLKKKLIAIMSGGFFPQFEKQLLHTLPNLPSLYSKLYLLPTSGACLYKYQNGKWCLLYALSFTAKEKQKIFNAFEKTFNKIGYEHPKRIYGEVIQDRGTQITFSAVGQVAPLAEKEAWRKYFDKRIEIQKELNNHIPEFEVRVSGMTSVDVTKKGIDKGYGIRQIEQFLKIPKSDMLFIGDALYEDGNDYPVMREGVESISVSGPHETKRVIEAILSNLRIWRK